MSTSNAVVKTQSVIAPVEEWRAIEGYEGIYEVSNLGAVRSIDRIAKRGEGSMTLHGRTLRPGVNPETGYLVVALWRDGIGKTANVHVLVARAFVLNPRGFPEVDHEDGERTNAAAANLRWATRSLNNLNNHNPRRKKIAAPPGIRFNAECGRRPWTVYLASKYIGAFPTIEAATCARTDALNLRRAS
jgi:hypothetical protein